jgi:hypothetical protein
LLLRERKTIRFMLHACRLESIVRRVAVLLARLAPMPLRLRGARIVELVGLAGAADAAYGCSTLFDCEKATVAAPAAAVPILGAPWVGIVWLLIGAGSQWRQDRH